VLVDLGVPLPQIEGPTRDIEITATRPSAAVAEPEKEADSGSDTLTDSLKPAKPKITVSEAF
jgi:hypothetical protein